MAADIPRLDLLAERFARTSIENIRRKYPQRVDGVISMSLPYLDPGLTHPAFHGSFDWHSCVHMHWLLVCLLRRFPDGRWRDEAIDALQSRLASEKIDIEYAFFLSPGNEVFERPYGWAWLLKLHAELMLAKATPSLRAARGWCEALEPLTRLLRERYLAYLRKSLYPIRAGTHANSAFAMMMGLDYASALGEANVHSAIRDKALHWFGHDAAYPASYEPDGEDFLSGGLLEAALMARLLDETRFHQWWRHFRPDDAGMLRWMTPVAAFAGEDAKIVHLDGLNLSRAWCWRLLARTLPGAMSAEAEQAAKRHLLASLPHSTGTGYEGTHWLASFATLALSA